MRHSFGIALALVGGLALSVAAQSGDLLTNGSFRDFPDPHTFKTMLTHSVWLEVPLPAGSHDLPGWTVGGPAGVVVMISSKQAGNRNIDLKGSGSIFQTVSTAPKQTYQFSFRLHSDREGQAHLPLTITVGEHSETMTLVPAQDVSKSLLYVATGPDTRVELRGGGSGIGPHVLNLSLTVYNAAQQSVDADARKIHARASSTLSRADVSGYMQLLSPDYHFESTDGKIQSRDEFEAWLAHKAETQATLSSTYISADRQDADVLITVDVRQNYQELGADNVQHRIAVRSRQINRWHQDGDHWVLMNTKEKAQAITIDGKAAPAP